MSLEASVNQAISWTCYIEVQPDMFTWLPGWTTTEDLLSTCGLVLVALVILFNRPSCIGLYSCFWSWIDFGFVKVIRKFLYALHPAIIFFWKRNEIKLVIIIIHRKRNPPMLPSHVHKTKIGRENNRKLYCLVFS